MDAVTTLTIAGMIERLAVAIIGGLALYLGFRLFIAVPGRQEGEAKFAMPGGLSVYLSRIGPGVFFALFGTMVVGYTAVHPITYGTFEKSPSGEVKQIQLSQFAPPSGTQSPAPPITGGVPAERVIKVLAEMTGNPTGPAPKDRDMALREARVSLMHQAWKPEWGDEVLFRKWVYDEAEQDHPPALINRAVDLYKGKDL